ncbi:Hypothetical predicted protein, partial [Pelobates cultripes]
MQLWATITQRGESCIEREGSLRLNPGGTLDPRILDPKPAFTPCPGAKARKQQ